MTDQTRLLPTLERILYDELYGTDTRFGLGTEQIFVDPQLAQSTVISILTDPNRDFEGVNIDEFVNNSLNFETPEDTIATMEAIYDTFQSSDVNFIFFQILKDAFTNKDEFEEIFKTSWVALEIKQNVQLPNPVPAEDLNIVSGGACFTGDEPLPTPTPSVTQSVPLPTVSWSATPLPSVTPTPSPSALPPETIIVSFDATNDLITVFGFDGADWTLVSQNYEILGAGFTSLNELSSNRIVITDAVNQQLLTLEWDGSNWTQIGGPLTLSSVSLTFISRLSNSRIALIDSNVEELTTYDFDGTNWSKVGNELSLPNTDPVSITSLSNSRVAIAFEQTDELATYEFDGTNWSIVGSPLSTPIDINADITALTSTRIAFIDTTGAGPKDLKTFDFNGITWSQTGSALGVSVANTPRIKAISNNQIAWIDAENDEWRTYEFDNVNWTQYGNTLPAVYSLPALGCLTYSVPSL